MPPKAPVRVYSIIFPPRSATPERSSCLAAVTLLCLYSPGERVSRRELFYPAHRPADQRATHQRLQPAGTLHGNASMSASTGLDRKRRATGTTRMATPSSSPWRRKHDANDSGSMLVDVGEQSGPVHLRHSKARNYSVKRRGIQRGQGNLSSARKGRLRTVLRPKHWLGSLQGLRFVVREEGTPHARRHHLLNGRGPAGVSCAAGELPASRRAVGIHLRSNAGFGWTIIRLSTNRGRYDRQPEDSSGGDRKWQDFEDRRFY